MKKQQTCFILISFLFFSSILATCVNECNLHGSCVGGVCQCQTGYGGSDCSIWDHSIVSGITQTGHLNTFQWKYYHFTTTDDLSTFSVYVNQTSTIGDIDLYIGKGYYPDSIQYDYSDTSTDDHLAFSTEVNGVSTWYIGLYGYWTADYSIILYSSLRGCTHDCGDHGHCEGSTCVCNEYYNGENCTIYDQEIRSGVVYASSIEYQEFKYYHFQGIPGQTVDIVLSQDDASYDLDLYIRRGERPTTRRFDYYNGTIAATTYMHLANVTGEIYEIGVYGYRTGGNYNLLVTQYLDDGSVCINDCSDHGECHSHSCSCDDSFSGPICETYTENMEFDTIYSGKVESSFWNYWHVHYFSDSSIRIDLHQESEGDCDIYVRSNSNPTSTIYQMANLSDAMDTSVLIHEPGDSTWYIGIFGWTSCTYSISAAQIAECQCEEGSHGRCAGNSIECICEVGYTGVSCTTQTTEIMNGQVFAYRTVMPNNWAFYYFTSASTAVSVTLVEAATSGKLMLILSMERYPSGENFEFYDIGPGDFHEVHLIWENSSDRVYYAGVTTSTVTMNSDPIVYSISAYGTPF